MRELSSLVREYLAFRVARGFQPDQKLQRLLNQFAGALPLGRQDGQLFTQGQALAWAHAPAGAAPAWQAYRLSAVRQFAAYLAGCGLPVGRPGHRTAHPKPTPRRPTTSCRRHHYRPTDHAPRRPAARGQGRHHPAVAAV